MNIDDAYKQVVEPTAVLQDSEHFLIKVAENDAEVEQALRLRYEVFNLEQGKGLKSAEETGIDRDEFDDHCLHLIVVEKDTDKVVGTYRIHHGQVAIHHDGFYSEREYDFTGLDTITSETLEVGRSCVHPEYRSGAAVAMLWGGIGALLKRAKLRYLLGCVSLETVCPCTGWALYHHFNTTEKVSDKIEAYPREAFILDKPDDKAIEDFMAEKKMTREIPPLFKGYLRLGTKVCGEPALDSEFGTIDYPILLDTFKIPERYARHFNYKVTEEQE